MLTEVLRLFPRKAEVWKYAAGYAERQGEIRSVRGYFMRAIRFCEKDWGLYLEWARVEIRWLAKIQERRRVLGLDGSKTAEKQSTREQQARNQSLENDDKFITLPTITAGESEGMKQDGGETAENALQKLDATPAMSGAIPKALFDSAMNTFKHDMSLAQRFFDMFAEHYQVPCSTAVLGHVVDHMVCTDQLSPLTLSCQCKMPIIGLAPDSPAFPVALRESLRRVRQSLLDSPNKSESGRPLAAWLELLAQDERLVPELKIVVTSTLRRTLKEVSKSLEADSQ